MLAEKITGGRILARHPWELTLREFVEKVRRDYNVVIKCTRVAGFSAWYLTRGKQNYLLPGLGEDEILPLPTLRSLCRAFSLPALDFHLDPEGDD